uniref:NHL repeat containing 4 n=1 Tax=Naja naja TaxID=35670 RepID=A0A8C6XIC0_NAJNA
MRNAHSISNFSGPRYVCSLPDGGFAVSEECGGVKLFDSSHKLVSSVNSKYGHQFGNPAGLCADKEGNMIVADEQLQKVHLFPKNGSPICLVSKGLLRPTGVACTPDGSLFVIDSGDNDIKPLLKHLQSNISILYCIFQV